MSAALAAWVKFYAAHMVAVSFAAGASFSSVSKIDDAFWPLFVRDVRAMRGGPDPRDVAAVMFSESGLTPGAANRDPDPKSPTFGQPRAIGINQLFQSNWARMLAPMTPAEYLALPASAQWSKIAGPFFRDHLAEHPEAAKRARDLYWLNFVPKFYVPDAPDDYVIPVSAAVVEANRAPLVLPGEDVIRAGNLDRFLRRSQTETKGSAARWAAILAAIDATEAGLGPSPVPVPVPPPQPVAVPDPAGSGVSLGTVLGVAAAGGVAWFAWSSWRAAARLKGAISAPVTVAD